MILKWFLLLIIRPVVASYPNALSTHDGKDTGTSDHKKCKPWNVETRDSFTKYVHQETFCFTYKNEQKQFLRCNSSETIYADISCTYIGYDPQWNSSHKQCNIPRKSSCWLPYEMLIKEVQGLSQLDVSHLVTTETGYGCQHWQVNFVTVQYACLPANEWFDLCNASISKTTRKDLFIRKQFNSQNDQCKCFISSSTSQSISLEVLRIEQPSSAVGVQALGETNLNLTHANVTLTKPMDWNLKGGVNVLQAGPGTAAWLHFKVPSGISVTCHKDVSDDTTTNPGTTSVPSTATKVSPREPQSDSAEPLLIMAAAGGGCGILVFTAFSFLGLLKLLRRRGSLVPVSRSPPRTEYEYVIPGDETASHANPNPVVISGDRPLPSLPKEENASYDYVNPDSFVSGPPSTSSHQGGTESEPCYAVGLSLPLDRRCPHRSRKQRPKFKSSRRPKPKSSSSVTTDERYNESAATLKSDPKASKVSHHTRTTLSSGSAIHNYDNNKKRLEDRRPSEATDTLSSSSSPSSGESDAPATKLTVGLELRNASSKCTVHILHKLTNVKKMRRGKSKTLSCKIRPEARKFNNAKQYCRSHKSKERYVPKKSKVPLHTKQASIPAWKQRTQHKSPKKTIVNSTSDIISEKVKTRPPVTSLRYSKGTSQQLVPVQKRAEGNSSKISAPLKAKATSHTQLTEPSRDGAYARYSVTTEQPLEALVRPDTKFAGSPDQPALNFNFNPKSKLRIKANHCDLVH